MSNTPTVPEVSTDDTLPADAPQAGDGWLPVRDRERYQRGAEIARGGMGRIVAADDLELGRSVAIKELLGASQMLELRFEREVKITSRLQHPGIIAVLDAGRWRDGAAFYTMPHVEGRALKNAIAGAASVEDRLALVGNVIAVAEALAYAHGRSVIHRDLKPSNILVGRFGETIVIDWGLAKDLGDAAEEPVSTANDSADDGVTVLGTAIGTPGYMAPEQARGATVDARADVYALGAILYHVLATNPPYHDATSASDVIDRVLAGPPRAIEELSPGAPRDLLAVVDKAMAREPADRYPTAAELAGDLRRFATGQLVGAHRYSTRQLLARWIARHRAPVAVAALAAVALAAVGVVAFQRVREQRDAAATERQVAEGHRDNVERLLDFMLIELHGKLEPIGKLDLLGMVADEASKYYASRPIDQDDFDEARRRGLAHVRLGDVRIASGDLPTALADYRAALAAFEPMGVSPELAKAQDKVGLALARQGDLVAALAAYRASVANREQLVSEDPSSDMRQRDLAGGYHKVGNALGAQGDIAGAIAEYRKGLAINQAVVARNPTHALSQRNLAVSHSKIGDALSMQEDLAGALTSYRASLATMEALAARDPDTVSLQFDVAAAHDNVAGVLQAQGDLAGALASYRASLAITERVAAHDPANTEWQHGLSISHVNVGSALRDQGDLGGALDAYRRAREIRARLAAQDPSNTEWQHGLSVIHERMAGVQQTQGKIDAALAGFRESLAIRERLAEQDPTNSGWARDVWIGRYKLGTVYEARGDEAGARAEYQTALVLAERWLAASPDVPEHVSDVEELRAWVARCCEPAAPK